MPGTLPVAERIPQDVPVQPEIIESSIVDEGVISPDAPPADNEEANQEAGQVYSRAHSDGQEFSGTLEQARKVCPALGRMSVENARATLQEEDLAARVARRGREKRQAETAKTDGSKARSDKPVDAEKSSTKVEAKQIENDDSRSVAATTLAAMPNKQLREAVQHTGVLPEPGITRQSKDTGKQAPAADPQDLFLRQAEAVRLPQVTIRISDEAVKITENEDVKAVGPVVEAVSSYSSMLEDEGLEMTKHPDTIIRRSPASVEKVMAEHRTDEEAARPIFTEGISKLGVAQLEAPEPLIPWYFVDEAEQTEISVSLDVPFREITDEQAGIETVQLATAEETEPVEWQENEEDYELLREDEVILLMADFEQSKAEIDEAGDSLLSEIFVSDPADAKVPGHTPAELQAVISVPELPAPVKEIEAAITRLTEVLESAEADETQKVYLVFEEIIMLPDGLEASTGEAKKDFEQKLEELFVRLFEQTGTEYTPELIDSFTKLTQLHYLKELLPIAIETEDGTQALPDEIGTHEFLQKLQHGLSRMKQTVVSFYELGGSVLRLYGMDKTFNGTLG
jgi:hypothetical protein